MSTEIVRKGSTERRPRLADEAPWSGVEAFRNDEVGPPGELVGGDGGCDPLVRQLLVRQLADVGDRIAIPVAAVAIVLDVDVVDAASCA